MWGGGRIWHNRRYTMVMSLSKTAGNGAKKNIPWGCHGMHHIPGGWGGIRTPGGVAPTTVFKTVAIDRSATHPKLFYRRSFRRWFCSLTATQRCRQNVTNARIIQYWGRVVNSSVGGKLLCLRTCGYVISLSPRREPT